MMSKSVCSDVQRLKVFPSSISPIKVDIFQIISLFEELNRLVIKHLGQLVVR